MSSAFYVRRRSPLGEPGLVFASKADGCGPHTQHVNSRIAGPPDRGRSAVRVGGGLLFSSLLLPSLKLSDTKVYEPEIRALLETASHFCEVVVLKLRTLPIGTALSLRTLRVGGQVALVRAVEPGGHIQPPAREISLVGRGECLAGGAASRARVPSSWSLLLSSLELSDTKVYEP